MLCRPGFYYMSLTILRKSRLNSSGKLSVVDHLEVLRSYLLRAVIAIVLGAVIVGFYNKFVVSRILLGPTHSDFVTYRVLCKIGTKFHLNSLCLSGSDVVMQSTGVSNQFSVFFNLVLIGGLILAFPYVFLQFWNFIKPALTKKELEKTRGVIFWVSLLFFLGVLFGYFFIAPYTVNFFANFQLDSNIENRWTINSYLDTLVPLILGSGLAFQLPLAMLFLGKINVVSSSFLKRKRKHAIVIMLILAGTITPPDMLSQIIVTLPLMILYEISILLVRRVEKQQSL